MLFSKIKKKKKERKGGIFCSNAVHYCSVAKMSKSLNFE